MKDAIPGATIKELRTSLRLTQEFFARLLGLRLRAFWNWESQGVPRDRRRRLRPFRILQALLELQSELVFQEGTLSEFALNVHEGEGKPFPEGFLPKGFLLPISGFADMPGVNAAGELFEALDEDLYADLARWLLGSLFLLGIPAAWQEPRLRKLKEVGQEFTEEILRALKPSKLMLEDTRIKKAREYIEEHLDEAGQARLHKLLENPKEVMKSAPVMVQLRFERAAQNAFQKQTGILLENLPGVGPEFVHGFLGEAFSEYLMDGWPPEGEGVKDRE